MSHTFYDSPDGANPALSIDVTHDYCWFFEEVPEREEDRRQRGVAKVRKEELPAIYKALGEYLELP